MLQDPHTVDHISALCDILLFLKNENEKNGMLDHIVQHNVQYKLHGSMNASITEMCVSSFNIHHELSDVTIY